MRHKVANFDRSSYCLKYLKNEFERKKDCLFSEFLNNRYHFLYIQYTNFTV
jgi:hypothetical protein